jgi:CheY-like chemotaxis protein
MLDQPARTLAGRRVLVVEDEYFIADEICALLREVDAEVAGPAPNVEQALALLDATAVDCAVLDLNLQGRSGIVVAQELSERYIPFIFVSGYDPGAVPAEFRLAPHFTKPFIPADIVRALEEAIERV